jgi:pimeloyl-ACP methyl ester carboxylesterase
MLKKILISLCATIVLISAGFVIWASNPLPAMPEAIQALQGDAAVTVQAGKWTTFTPTNHPNDVGLIYYPGGRVDYRAYAPTALALADQGYPVFLTRMPLNLAMFGLNQADEIIAANPQIKTWVIGGHSLGGAMACTYVYNHPGKVQGLVLLAAYPAASNSLADQNLKVISIHGSEDGLATAAKMDAARALLPPTTQWVEIQGGNHSQMGWYGLQPGDGTAAISREDQQRQVVSAIQQFLKEMEE